MVKEQDYMTKLKGAVALRRLMDVGKKMVVNFFLNSELPQIFIGFLTQKEYPQLKL